MSRRGLAPSGPTRAVRHVAVGLAALGAILVAGTARAADGELETALHGDVKAFVVGTFPYDSELVGEGAVQGIGDGRLKLSASYGRFAAEAHHAVSLLEGQASGLPGASTGVALTAPEAVDLTWQIDNGAAVVRGRTDRLWVRGRFGAVDATVGRQPVSFGTGRFFTPLDLVAPFHPATIDQEYKPGVDAVRVDAYAGTSGQVSLVAAYAGDWDLQGTVLAAYGQGTLGVTDVGLFLGSVHADRVAGLALASSIGAVGVHADATVTVPEEGDPFVRAVAGADWMPTGRTTVAGEVYVQTFGADDPADYLIVARSERFARGEVWQMGRYYGALAVSQEITPLVSGSLAFVANLGDPSLLVTPNVSWSVAGNATVSAGAWLGVGERPAVDTLPVVDPTAPPDVDGYLRSLGVQSEFGLYPAAVFLRLATYF